MKIVTDTPTKLQLKQDHYHYERITPEGLQVVVNSDIREVKGRSYSPYWQVELGVRVRELNAQSVMETSESNVYRADFETHEQAVEAVVHFLDEGIGLVIRPNVLETTLFEDLKGEDAGEGEYLNVDPSDDREV